MYLLKFGYISVHEAEQNTLGTPSPLRCLIMNLACNDLTRFAVLNAWTVCRYWRWSRECAKSDLRDRRPSAWAFKQLSKTSSQTSGMSSWCSEDNALQIPLASSCSHGPAGVYDNVDW